MRRLARFAVLLAVTALASACTSDVGDRDATATDDGVDLGDPGECIVVDATVSPEKIDLMTALARSFNDSDEAEVDGECVFVRPQRKSSGGSAQLLIDGWDEATQGPRPVLWSPAASTWGGVVDQELTVDGQTPIAGDGEPFMLTPLVIAMPEPMAQALGHPTTPLGWTDIFTLAGQTEGWAAYGHPEWGPFRLGKTNPNLSTSGLAALVAQAYAANGKTSGLSAEDLARPEATTFGQTVESAVVHYGDTTLTFLNNLYRADQRGSALNYVSAVAVEEKSVIDYNLGNPDGILEPGEEPRPPRVPLVAIYPKEGTLFSDNPLFVLDAEWVDDRERQGAERFIDYVQRPENQERVLEFGFRPGSPQVAIAAPIVTANGVDPGQPQTLLEVPEPPVLTALLDQWDVQRKKAQVVLLLDVSGSMGDPANFDDLGGPTKLDLAKQAIGEAIALFSPEDIVSLEVFSTDLFGEAGAETVELVAPGRIADIGEELRRRVRDLTPQNATPLYTATQTAYEKALDSYDPARINAVVVLSDGVNDDGDPGNDDDQFNDLLAALRSGSEGQASRPVRVFPIAYGEDADLPTLRTVAEAASSALYNSTDATAIRQVLTAVISNF